MTSDPLRRAPGAADAARAELAPAALRALPGVEAFVTTLADEARRISMSYFRRALAIDVKMDDSPVTVADREVERCLRARIAARFPSHGLLGEEHGSERLDADYLWVIDPLDGTRSFISGWPLWGTLVALLYRGEALLGLIDVPVLDERWLGVAARDSILWRHGERALCRTRECTRLRDAMLYTTSPDNLSPAERQVFDSVSAHAASRRFGGDCYSYGLLAAGHLDTVLEAGLQPYDYLALVPVVDAAGGVITDWTGQPLGPDSNGRVLASATPALHQEILAFTRHLV